MCYFFHLLYIGGRNNCNMLTYWYE